MAQRKRRSETLRLAAHHAQGLAGHVTLCLAADPEGGPENSDFRVLELLLHKGLTTPVNAIGPKVNLNPGSVSVAVDRLYRKRTDQSGRMPLRSPREDRVSTPKAGLHSYNG